MGTYPILHEAVFAANVALIQSLLEHGEDVNEIDSGGYTPLDCALDAEDGEENPEIIRLLLYAGASVTGGRWGTPLHGAVARRQMTTIQLLLEHGAEANAEDLDGDTPLALAQRTARYSSLMAEALPTITEMLRASVDRKGRSVIAHKSATPRVT